MARAEEAVRYSSDGLLCSQAILLAFGLPYGIDRQTALRIARPFGTGVARMCGTCGAVSGAYMVLGLSCELSDEKSAKEWTYGQIREFTRRFEERHGSINCAELLGVDLGKPEGQAKFRANNLVARCRSFIKEAGKILEEMLTERAENLAE